MRTLLILSVIQTLCLLVLVFRSPGDPGTELQPEARTPQVTRNAENPFAAPAKTVDTGSPMVDAATLRQVVREELRRVAGSLESREESSRHVVQQADPHQRDRVEDRIDYYKSVGRVEPDELNDLMREMGKLDEQTRRQLMPELMRALNDREIDGRF